MIYCQHCGKKLESSSVCSCTSTIKIVQNDYRDNESYVGWQCPICKKVHAPEIKECLCRKSDSYSYPISSGNSM